MGVDGKLRSRRIELGLTLEEVGKIAGVTKSTVKKWESGAIANMRKDKIALLAKALKVSPTWIMGLDDVINIIPFKTKRVPLLGTIAAGEPILATEDQRSFIEIDESLHVDFCLKIKGDSMIDARINNDDIVFVRKQPCVENGEIAVVLIDNEATLKRFYINDGGVILKPENSKYQPKFYAKDDFKDIRILGKAVFFQSEVK